MIRRPPRSTLFPTRRSSDLRWLAAHVVGDAVDAAHFVDDAAFGLFQEAVGKLGPVGGHEVAGLDGAQ